MFGHYSLQEHPIGSLLDLSQGLSRILCHDTTRSQVSIDAGPYEIMIRIIPHLQLNSGRDIKVNNAGNLFFAFDQQNSAAHPG